MSSELGRLEKPEAEPFQAQRRVYLVPLVFAPRQPSPDYADLYERYWRGVREHLLRLEGSLGAIAHVYHEGIGLAGEEGIGAAEQVSPKSASVARSKVESGASFEALEDGELVAESLDWQRCLLVGLQSRKVAEYVWSSYSDAMRQRYEVMARRLDETLKPGESGLLFIAEDHRLQFPTDVRVFYVAPPALDEIHRWLRDQQSRSRPSEAQPEAQSDETPPPEAGCE